MGLPEAALATGRDLERCTGFRVLSRSIRRCTQPSRRFARFSSISRMLCRVPSEHVPMDEAGPSWVRGIWASGIGPWRSEYRRVAPA